MKKRCTNSACRKFFLPDSVCPFCGKKYPRIPSINHDVYLVDSGKKKIKTVCVIRNLDARLSLLEIKTLVDNCPCVIKKELPLKDAQLWYEELKKVGASAKII